ncbi:MAG: hypothetical protein AAF804_16530 [Bacteroidota bacterium]
MDLYAFLKSQNLFSEEECVSIDAAFDRAVIPKGTVIQTVNRYSKRLLFIESGLFRVYYLEDGKDITHFFFDENYFLAPIRSIYYNESELYEWETLETCTIKIIQFDEFQKLGEQYPKLIHIVLDFTIKMLDLFSQKLNLLKFQTALDKYHVFLDMYPNLTNRVSLGNVASFLGITQSTLSVVRSQKK